MTRIQQQKIYIDVDEEITTVIDHLRRMSTTNIALIVPQRALLLQSVVNLKLLAQEAKKMGKNIVLMTRDEDGIAFATRAGINVQPFISEDDEAEAEVVQQTEQKKVPKFAKQIMQGEVRQKTHADVGSSSFFDNGANQKPQVSGITTHVSQKIERSQKQIRMSDMSGGPVSNNKDSKPIIQKINTKPSNINNHNAEESLEEYEQSLRGSQIVESNDAPGVFTQIEESAEFERKPVVKNKRSSRKKASKDLALSGSFSFVAKGLAFGGLLLVVFIFLIILLPKTDISLIPKHIDIDETIELTAQTNQSVRDEERRLIPARLIEKDITFTKTFEATGKGDVKAQKARGTITIFNTYSKDSQPLVATTRFLAENGTLFRLVNPVVIPGMNGDEPGKIDALVEADKPGENGNIGPTRFSIPGFSSSEKRDKFYAVSENAMTGGGTGGKGVRIVTDSDIEKAKEQMQNELKEYITGQLTGLLRPNEVLIDENIKSDILRSEANASSGTATDQFMYEIVAHVKTIVFSQDDVIAVLESSIAQKYNQFSADSLNLEVEYSKVTPDFDNEEIQFKANGKSEVVSTVNTQAFKNDIRGKKHSEIENILKEKYNDEIDKITIERVMPGFPSFIANHISRFSFMTKITVKQ